MLTLVIGGARSGKSRYAQSLCAQGSRVAYLATARLEDDEMRAKATRHRSERPVAWLTIEEPLQIAALVRLHSSRMEFILLDCLTVWLSNFCEENNRLSASELELSASSEIDSLIEASALCHLVVVTNEVGSGIVPESPLGRLFRDFQGLVNQQMAREADVVYHTVAGIALQIKPVKVCV
jgi:adenosylcobinamide kinase/adenosylcobinamide-phosphate guanylyltransferase